MLMVVLDDFIALSVYSCLFFGINQYLLCEIFISQKKYFKKVISFVAVF